MIRSNQKSVVWLSVAIFFLFSLLIIQFYQIQIVQNEKWTHEAAKQHYFFVNEPFQRGKFISNPFVKKNHPEDAQSFVIDVQVFHLYADPQSIPKKHKEHISKSLIKILKIASDEQKKFKNQFFRKSRSRKLAMWLDADTQSNVQSWWLPYAKKYKIPRNALFFVPDYQRSYPFGKLLGQVLHTIQLNKNELTKQAVPTGGLELYFNKYLQGKLGKRRLMRSPRNSFETGEILAYPEHGSDIYLTINHYLQAIAEEEIAKGVKNAKAKSGWAVMMDPFTGEILAIAQYPFFHPSDYPVYFNDAKLIEETRVKAVSDANEPGSVMKPFIMAAALKANEELKAKGEKPIFSPQEKMSTSNSHFKGRSKPLKDTHFHAFLNMDMALQKSSNIYFARLTESIIERLGKEWFRKTLTDFGFGEKTHIELPGESSGVLPMPEKKHPNGTFEWSASTPYSLAIGHNIQVNSIQLVRAYATFANGGYLVQPTLIRKIIKTKADGTNEIILDNTIQRKQKICPKILSDESIQNIVTALKYATKPGGTAPRAGIWGYTEAGKTGTANKIINGHYSETQYCSTFVGFAPVKKPAFVLLVTIDEPEYGYAAGIGKKHHGGTCAAPVFREIGSRTLQYLGITPDDPHGYPVGDPRYDKNKADWITETGLLKEKYETWNKSKE